MTLAEPHAVRLVLAYDGTEFCGWQRQPNVRTVQGELDAAIAKMGQPDPKTRGVSRTDSGVHAQDQRVSFDTDRTIAEYGWHQGLNQHLPDDVRVKAVHFDEVGYDPRRHARRKLYRYMFQLGYAQDPLLRHRAWYVGPSLRKPGERLRPENACEWLDIAAMQDAATRLTGTHDFGAFQAANDERTDRVRTLFAVSIADRFHGRQDLVALEVHGNAFLKNMVRVIAGTLLDVGRQHRPAGHVSALLKDRDRRSAGPTAPPQGLTLVRVDLNEES